MATHVLFARREASESRARFDARTSILEELHSRMKRGEVIPDDEYSRLLALSRRDEEGDERSRTTRWSEVFLGRKDLADDADIRAEEDARREWEAGQLILVS